MTSKYADSHLISTSALAKRLDLPAKALFELFVEKGWIERAGDNWRLTGKGQFEGGDYVSSKKYGEYIGWPESVLEHIIFAELFNRPLRTRAIGKELDISAHRFNALLAELGWQKKFHRGWVLTVAGKAVGGSEQEDEESGVPYTLWPRTVLDNIELQHSIEAATIRPKSDNNNQAQQDSTQQSLAFDNTDSVANNGEFRGMDGHILDHREDLIVNNWFYLMNVTHAYQRKLTDESLGHCDFYLPSAHLYIECWHDGDTGQALNKKMARLDYYQANQLAFFEITADDLEQLDTMLPKQLLKHGIIIY